MRSLFLVMLSLSGAGQLFALQSKEKPPATYSITLPPEPDFSAVDWLVGEWTGKTAGKDPPGEVRLTAAYDLGRRFMVLREDVALPPTKAAPAARESWMAILGPRPSGRGFAMRAYSSTGFVTLYDVTVRGDEIYFNQEGGEQPPPGWLFRRVLERVNDTELSETVRVAPPDKPFFDYYTARLTRVTARKEAPAGSSPQTPERPPQPNAQPPNK